MTDFLTENFTGGAGAVTSHTSDSGNTWTDAPNIWFGIGSHAGNLQLDGSGFVKSTSSSTYGGVVSNVVPPSADYYVEAKVRVNSASSVAKVGIAVRYDEATGNGYFFLCDNSGDSTDTNINISAYDGSGHTLDSSLYFAVANGNDYTIRVEIVGSNIDVFLDGVLAESFTSTLVTDAGSIGFWIRGDTVSSDASINYITAGPLGSAFFWQNL